MSDVPVLLYDGSCGFCARSVQFVLNREPEAARTHLRFTPLQGAFAQQLHARHPGEWPDSLLWFEPEGERLLVYSDAALRVATHLGGVWAALAAVGRLVPRVIRDGVYRLIARHRQRLAPMSCMLPTPEQSARFLP